MKPLRCVAITAAALALLLLLGLAAGCGGKSENQSPDGYAGPYVSSAGRKPFHRPTCPWAQKILPENKVEYPTRPKAIQAGHRPCATCNP